MSDTEEFKFYNYDPSFAAGVIFVALFSLASIRHLWLLIQHRTWHFIPFFIGCLFEAIGFVGRALSAKETPNWTLGPYLIQTLLLLLGPTLLAASIYMTLGRLIRLLDANEYSLIRTTWLTKVFVVGDFLSFQAQSAGGGMLASAKTEDEKKMGRYAILGGLGLQVLFFGFFMVVTCIFHYRIVRSPTTKSYTITTPWHTFIYVLYFASVLIMIRSVFRMAEYYLGEDGELQSREVYILIFDASLMFLTVAALLWCHPSTIMKEQYDNLDHPGHVEARAESYLMDTSKLRDNDVSMSNPRGTRSMPRDGGERSYDTSYEQYRQS